MDDGVIGDATAGAGVLTVLDMVCLSKAKDTSTSRLLDTGM